MGKKDIDFESLIDHLRDHIKEKHGIIGDISVDDVKRIISKDASKWTSSEYIEIVTRAILKSSKGTDSTT